MVAHRLTIWINPEPALVISHGVDNELIVRQAAGDYNLSGVTATAGFEISRGAAKHFVYTISGVESEEHRAILNRIKNRQFLDGPGSVFFRDETQRIDALEIDGFGSRVRLTAPTYPDSEKTLSGITIAHFESRCLLEVEDRYEQLQGYGSVNYSSLTFQIVEIV